MTTQIVFFGSSEFSLIVLKKLLNAQGLSLCAVVTTPDAPAGRHLKLTPNPVKVFAQKNNIPVYTSPLSFPSPIISRARGCAVGEGAGGEVLGLVAAYGKIIPQSVIDIFGGHIYNIHPSLLPKYKGPSPLQQQILDGVTQTGVTIIQLDALTDHGPIVTQAKSKITPTDTTVTLGVKLFSLGTDLFLSQLRKATPFKAKPQNHSLATYTHKLTRQDGFVSWEEYQTQDLDRKLRAFVGWPGVWTINPQGERVKIS